MFGGRLDRYSQFLVGAVAPWQSVTIPVGGQTAWMSEGGGSEYADQVRDRAAAAASTEVFFPIPDGAKR